MATWGAHIRIAEGILNEIDGFEKEDFLVGNIGADCGEPNEDWSVFTPPKKISHWLNDENTIDANKFYETHIKDYENTLAKKSFMIGYYIHLLTDIAWIKMIRVKRKNDPLYQPLIDDKNFIWTIKKDWYDLDHLYFKKNPNSIFHNTFINIKNYQSYLAYYSENAVDRQVKYIQNFYGKHDGEVDREYVYLKEDEMNIFVNKYVEEFITLIRDKKLI